MPVLTGGMISIKPFRADYNGPLEPLLAEVLANKYPVQPDAPSSGFGSVMDEPSVVNGSSELVFSAGDARIEDASIDGKPRRLRCRFYYDVLNRQLLKHFGEASNWRRIYNRAAFDITVYENTGEQDTAVLVSARDDSTIRKHAVSAVKALFPADDDAPPVAVTDDIPEVLTSDFFLWILYRFQKTQKLADDIYVTWVEEMTSKDGMKRGARFTDDAAFGRVDMASLIAGGTANFGPAKVEIRDDVLDANFSMELHFDGGFNAFRSSSHYSGIEFRPETLGMLLTDDLWVNVLPRIRDDYNNDKEWTATGRDELKELALEAVKKSLGL